MLRMQYSYARMMQELAKHGLLVLLNANHYLSVITLNYPCMYIQVVFKALTTLMLPIFGSV